MPTFETEKDHVGPGWQKLVELVHNSLTEYLGEDYQVLQIKEKFGGLRYYYTQPGEVADNQRQKDYARGCVSLAEAVSFYICEECGNPGECRPIGGWYKTLCDEHRAELERNHGKTVLEQ